MLAGSAMAVRGVGSCTWRPSIPPARTRVSVIRHEFAENAPQWVLVAARCHPAAVSRLSRAVAGVPIPARHVHATEPHLANAGAVSSQSNKPHLNLPGFRR